MDKLPADQQEQLKKCSTERLRMRLVQTGLDEEAILQMDRPKLLEAMARVMTEQETKGETGDEARGSTEIRLRELALEEKRIEAETRNKELEAEARRMEIELRKRELETDRELRLLELRGRLGGQTTDINTSGVDVGARRAWDDSLEGRTKRYGETLRHVLPQMPTEATELPQFFDTVEKLYAMYQVPADLQAKLLIPLLTGHAKSVIGRMPSHNMEQYDELKRFLLAEFKLTPKEYKFRFDSVVKGHDETYVLFTAIFKHSYVPSQFGSGITIPLYSVFSLSSVKYPIRLLLSVMVLSFLLRLRLATSVSSSIPISPSLTRSLLSLRHVFTTFVIFVAYALYLILIQLALLAHHLFIQGLTFATHCTMVFLKTS